MNLLIDSNIIACIHHTLKSKCLLINKILQFPSHRLKDVGKSNHGGISVKQSGCISVLQLACCKSFVSHSLSSELPCTMSLEEMKSLFRMDDIIVSAPQSIMVLEVSARSGEGLQEVLNWLDSTQPD